MPLFTRKLRRPKEVTRYLGLIGFHAKKASMYPARPEMPMVVSCFPCNGRSCVHTRLPFALDILLYQPEINTRGNWSLVIDIGSRVPNDSDGNSRGIRKNHMVNSFIGPKGVLELIGLPVPLFPVLDTAQVNHRMQSEKNFARKNAHQLIVLFDPVTLRATGKPWSDTYCHHTENRLSPCSPFRTRQTRPLLPKQAILFHRHGAPL